MAGMHNSNWSEHHLYSFTKEGPTVQNGCPSRASHKRATGWSQPSPFRKALRGQMEVRVVVTAE